VADETRDLVVLVTHAPNQEKATVGFTIANGGMTAGLSVSIFLASDGVDIARKKATDIFHSKPFDPLGDLVEDFLRRGGALWACTPCCDARGYTQDDLIAGTIITGASVMHEKIKKGAATLSF
jgi:predicted peroxiredoxin